MSEQTDDQEETFQQEEPRPLSTSLIKTSEQPQTAKKGKASGKKEKKDKKSRKEEKGTEANNLCACKIARYRLFRGCGVTIMECHNGNNANYGV